MTTPPGSPSGERSPFDAGLRTERPPARFVAVRSWVLDTVGELAAFRQQLREEINSRSGAPAAEELGTVAHDLVLVASELATNGIKHGRPPTIVELRQDGREFLLTVADHDLGTEPRIAGERPPGEGGFGLQIARRLARDVGWYRTDTVKVIWAALGP